MGCLRTARAAHICSKRDFLPPAHGGIAACLPGLSEHIAEPVPGGHIAETPKAASSNMIKGASGVETV